jgi:Mg2+-importing ATPase
MLSMSVASIAIPFLPLLPAQVLLNNLLYDLSELGIPFDHVEADALARPHHWDMRTVLRAMLVLGPVSSVFDLATFVLLRWAETDVAGFRTAWFLESMATQILVIFLIRGAGHWRQATLPHPALLTTSLGALVLAVFLALGPLAVLLGFGPVEPWLLGAVGGLTVLYLASVAMLMPLARRP